MARQAQESKQKELRRADALRNDERILEAAKQLLEQSPSATLSDIASAAGVSRSTLYRRFADRDQLIAKLDARPEDGAVRRAEGGEGILPAGHLGRQSACQSAFIDGERQYRESNHSTERIPPGKRRLRLT